MYDELPVVTCIFVIPLRILTRQTSVLHQDSRLSSIFRYVQENQLCIARKGK